MILGQRIHLEVRVEQKLECIQALTMEVSTVINYRAKLKEQPWQQLASQQWCEVFGPQAIRFLKAVHIIHPFVGENFGI